MPEDTSVPTDEAERLAAQQALQRLANLEDRGVTGSYANFVRVTGSPEEVVLDFCLVPNPAERSEEKIEIQNRVVLSYYGAKRLLAALHQTVGRHEQRFGGVELDVRKRLVNPPAEGTT
jgi:hypothetical protein